MERIDKEFTEASKEPNADNWMRDWEKSHRRGKIFGGMILVGIGSLFLAREMGLEIPHWIFSWKVLLIVIGIFVGVKHSFQSGGWMIPILIGTAFLLRDHFPELAISHYIWPLAIILFGLYVMFKPKRKNCYGKRKWSNHKQWKQYSEQYTNWEEKNSDNYCELNAIFGGIEKNIITKDFKGGEINTIFGGSEINLSQADINGRVELEVNTIFGGTKLIVPPHWEIKSDISAILGSVEDKRRVQKDIGGSNNKVLVLRGNVVFGGIDIQSF